MALENRREQSAEKKQSLRSCIACKRVYPRRQLTRFMKDAEGNLHFDERKKLPGRGAYICSESCFDKALEKTLFERALRAKVQIHEADCVRYKRILHGKVTSCGEE